MALPSSLIVSGATGAGTNTASTNGTYVLSTGVDAQGLQYYIENTGGNYLYYLNSQNSWWINNVLDQIGSGYYKAGTSSVAPSGSGWTQAGNPAVWGGSGTTVAAGVTNPQISQGGLAVLVPTATGGLISGADTIGTYYIYSPTGTKLGSGAETSTTTIAGITITPTGSTVASPNGGVIRTYTLSASAAATLGTGYKFGVYPASTGAPAYGLYDVIASTNLKVIVGGTAVLMAPSTAEEAYAYDDVDRAFAYNPDGTLNYNTYGAGQPNPKLSIVWSGSTVTFNGRTYKTWLVSAPTGHSVGTGFVLKGTDSTSTFDFMLPFDVVAPNPQVPVGGTTYTSCPVTGSTGVSSGAWAVLNSAGTQVDAGATYGGNGANGLFNITGPSTFGGPVGIEALAGATVGTNYQFRCGTTSPIMSGPFDVVAGSAVITVTRRRAMLFY